MIGARHEEYRNLIGDLPFSLGVDLERNSFNCSREQNWHENLEIQWCTAGQGVVLLNGEKYPFKQNDIVVVNSNVIHYTVTDDRIVYTCLIISAQFCKRFGIDYDVLEFSPFIQDAALTEQLQELIDAYSDDTAPFRVAKVNEILLRLLIYLAENHAVRKSSADPQVKNFNIIKATIRYIRENYNRKIGLDEISKAVFCDKFALCREFKKLTGQTVVSYTNQYRCLKAVECLTEGYTVAQTASLCGFENLSFFTKTFKRYMGNLPSAYKNNWCGN